jgi:hypothetical protein
MRIVVCDMFLVKSGLMVLSLRSVLSKTQKLNYQSVQFDDYVGCYAASPSVVQSSESDLFFAVFSRCSM